ncbi:MAG: alpha/beta hydrolase [Blautia sp.]|nr:alpha/beta hydrolase [Blautia sp.]
MELLGEKNYQKLMDSIVIPFLDTRKKAGTFEPVKGQKLYYEHFRADEPVGIVVMLHGFSEAIDKLKETAYYFVREGFHVWMLQQREHGRSFRSTDDPALIHIVNYEDLVRDLHLFVETVVKKNPEASRFPRYLFAHSMGGGVSSRCLEEYPDDFEKAVLSSPMLELNTGGTPVWAAAAYSNLMRLLGRGKAYMPGSAPFSGKEDFANSASNCRERYLYWLSRQRKHPEFQMCVSAIATGIQFLRLTREATLPENCAKVKAQVLLFQAGHDTFVSPGGQDTFIRQIGKKGRIVRMPDAKHEIYLSKNEDLRRYWEEILAFLKG